MRPNKLNPARLIEFLPFDYTVEGVQQCLKGNLLRSFPFTEEEDPSDADQASRVAWLVLNPDSTPVEVDLGCPSFPGHRVVIHQGCHQIAAAAFRGDKHILAHCSGEVSYIKEMSRAVQV